MNITQTFYDNLASQYDKLFFDWQAATREQAVILDKLIRDNGFDPSARILDCACGIGSGSAGGSTAAGGQYRAGGRTFRREGRTLR